ncbi:NADAR family protein [Phytomonospora sp. NPDC050363]|uniref:NADAR family protein n=1 Tax=Phytomonospora sp. NPDC050363 TaxID=3155642 RepID=UPI003406EAFD
MSRNRTWREVDGVRVEGTRRPVFVNNGGIHFLTDLEIYADGVIHCSGHLNLDGLATELASGRISVAPPEGARASAHHLAAWTFAAPHSALTPPMLLGEVADEIELLNGRPDSRWRCLASARAWAADPSEDKRFTLREAYHAVPEHLRRYLGDMDNLDRFYRIAITDVGEHVKSRDREFTVTAELHERARHYFTEQAEAEAAWKAKVPADGPKTPASPTVAISGTIYPSGWPTVPGTEALQIEYPAPIRFRDRDYPSVAHAYWALSTTDPEAHDRIAAAERGWDADKLAAAVPRREGWPEARLAVMAALLRANFSAHPALAAILLATGDGRIVYTGMGGDYWCAGGTNWIGRLLEVVRAELKVGDVLR